MIVLIRNSNSHGGGLWILGLLSKAKQRSVRATPSIKRAENRWELSSNALTRKNKRDAMQAFL